MATEVIGMIAYGVFFFTSALRSEADKLVRSSLYGQAILGTRSYPAFWDALAVMAIVTSASVALLALLVMPWWIAIVIWLLAGVGGTFTSRMLREPEVLHILDRALAVPLVLGAAALWWGWVY